MSSEKISIGGKFLEIKIKVAERIKKLMVTENISQRELAKRINVSSSAVCAWLSGKKEPSIESLWKLANYFDETVDYLIGRTEI